MRSPTGHLRPGARAIAASFIASGTIHLLHPAAFDPLIPPELPYPRVWIGATGVAELASAGGLLAGAKWAPAAATATLLVVWPGNWWHAIRLQRSRAHPAAKAAAWLRVPLQVPMLLSARRPYRHALAPTTA